MVVLLIEADGLIRTDLTIFQYLMRCRRIIVREVYRRWEAFPRALAARASSPEPPLKALLGGADGALRWGAAGASTRGGGGGAARWGGGGATRAGAGAARAGAGAGRARWTAR